MCGEELECMKRYEFVSQMQIAVDSATGNIFWYRYRSIYGYNASDDQVSIIYRWRKIILLDDIGGIAFMNGSIYFTDQKIYFK
jgi:hypothetical protein